MTTLYYTVSFAYLALTCGLWWFERRRTRNAGIDLTTIFLILFSLQCLLPGVVIYALLPISDPWAPTANEVYNRILRDNNVFTALTVFSFTGWFVIWFYAGLAIGGWALKSRKATHTGNPTAALIIRERELLALLLAGVAVTLWSFYLLGDTLRTRYLNLILFRTGFESISRTAVNANAFALTQAWSWLSVVAALYEIERKRIRLAFLCVACIALFALLGVSRRAFFLPLLLVYLAVGLYRNRMSRRWVVAASLPLILWIAYGKSVLGAAAFGGSVLTVVESYRSWVTGILSAACDVGISTAESLGTLLFLHVDPRFGVDHVLSLARRFPEGILGLDFNFPERVVRLSTATFADSYAADIPPGFIGQMWLDFRVAGPVVWGLAFGFQLALAQILFVRVKRSLAACAVFTVLVFILALPVNTGSFDFTFSVDIFAVLFALLLSVGLHRQRGNPEAPPISDSPMTSGHAPAPTPD